MKQMEHIFIHHLFLRRSSPISPLRMAQQATENTTCELDVQSEGVIDDVDGNESQRASKNLATQDNMEKSPTISLTDKAFLNNVTRPNMGIRKKIVLGGFVTCILMSLIMIKAYIYKGKSLLGSTNHASYVDALDLFHRTNTWSSIRQGVSNYVSSSDFSHLQSKIMDGVNENLNEFRENMSSELSAVKKKIEAVDARLQKLQNEVNLESAASVRGVVLKNFPEIQGENLATRVDRLLREGLGIEVKVDKVQRRTQKYTQTPNIAIVLLENEEDRDKVLNARSKLRQNAEFGDVVVEDYSSRESRQTIENFQTLIKLLGKEEEMILKGGKLTKKSKA
ncbi:uncharacterized protein [Ptychodera flava]|uniref:uncharacterized protein isoform X1 n=2 Tax=Ptychodera flava TaxID=63121 RepID=UPI00396AB01B